ncbi:OmpA family protein [Marinoscillum sp. MHG1-6]|uniref:OmpA family protein n=1 Tax=Marinoscillum sp. MHG1-6 TaxID=2959627 RepID=UPI0021572A9A|nr:OmpA family protein [Marinoscillum sp. MHG1-6]
MSRVVVLFILQVLGATFWLCESSAQNKPARRSAINFRLDSLPPEVQLNIYHFKNINKIPDHYNADKMAQIRKLEKEGKWEELYPLLSSYVSEFGIQNFYKDTRLIWRLAKLTELYGDFKMAKDLYRLVLRHHYTGINLSEIEIYYDTLNNQEAESYVPLDYYYELVEYRKLIDTLRPPRGVLLNMGPEINSPMADYGPTLSVKNNVLFFTSKRNELDLTVRKKQNEDLFYSIKDEYGNWSQAKEFKQVNSNYNEGSAYLSKNGKTLYFSRCDCIDCYGDCDIFTATLQEDSTWGEIKNLGINVNSLAWDSHPALSHSEDTLYFASDRIGGFGLADIYFTYKTKNGQWAPAQNLGPVINTRKNDVSPFYHPVFDVLYFSSNGQLYNFGEFDIYKSYQVNGDWSEPLNIGPLVNGQGSEFYFTIDNNSELLFYARSLSRDLNKQDIYSFPLPMEAQPLATTLVVGSLTDSLTGQPFKGIVSIIDLDEGIEVAPKFLRPDGSFEFKLIDQRNYLLVIQGDDFFRIEDAFFLDGPTSLDKVTEPIASRVEFESIEFDNGRSEMKEEMYADLNKVVNFLYDNPSFKLIISGHTDSYGTDEFNLQLSKDRAKNIRDYIVEFAGVEAIRVEWEGYGNTRPIVEEHTEADMALNRRVEFEIYRPATKDKPAINIKIDSAGNATYGD